MTITHQGAGCVLSLSRAEWDGSRRSAGDDLRETLLPLIRAAFLQAGRAIPPAMEVHLFPARQGALLLVMPRPGFSPPGILTELS